MNFNQIDRTGSVEGFALVKSCEKKTTKNGSTFLDITLADKTGEINAKMWDYREGAFLPEVNTVIKVRGVIAPYNGVPQMKIDRARAVWENDGVNMNDFVPGADYDGNYMFSEITALVNNFEDAELKKLVSALLDEYKDRMIDWPAAFRLHHAIKGGLLMHTLSIVRMCQSVAALYPTVDEELLISGAILHDIAKTEEFKISPVGLAEGYTADGTLIGHLVRGAMAVERVGSAIGSDKNTMMLLEHMIISHHGEPEFGAAVRPLFLEAEILSTLDALDAKIYEFESATSDIEPGEFSNRQWALNDRKLYNHGRKKIETKVNFND